MCFRTLGLLALTTFSLLAADTGPSPVSVYAGTWRVTRNGQAAGTKPEELINRCAEYSRFFACEQSVNGSVVSIVIYAPASTAGEFHVQSIMPDGRAGGLGGLTINGNTWTFTNTWNKGGGQYTYYKTIKTLTGKDKFHFEQQESSNREDWKTTGSGDEVRAAPGRVAQVR